MNDPAPEPLSSKTQAHPSLVPALRRAQDMGEGICGCAADELERLERECSLAQQNEHAMQRRLEELLAMSSGRSAGDETKASRDAALATFTEYFVRNYPGPHTIISDPTWHAPKIFRAALHAIKTEMLGGAQSVSLTEPEGEHRTVIPADKTAERHFAFAILENGKPWFSESCLFDTMDEAREGVDSLTDGGRESPESYKAVELFYRTADKTTEPSLCDGEVRVIYEHGEPHGVRDASGFLCFFNPVTKFPGQEDRYQRGLALRARHAEVIANALRGAQKSAETLTHSPEPSAYLKVWQSATTPYVRVDLFSDSDPALRAIVTPLYARLPGVRAELNFPVSIEGSGPFCDEHLTDVRAWCQECVDTSRERTAQKSTALAIKLSEYTTAQDAWNAVDALIKDGPLPGNGWDKQAERNGLILAANTIAQLPGVVSLKCSPEKPTAPATCPNCERKPCVCASPPESA